MSGYSLAHICFVMTVVCPPIRMHETFFVEVSFSVYLTFLHHFKVCVAMWMLKEAVVAYHEAVVLRVWRYWVRPWKSSAHFALSMCTSTLKILGTWFITVSVKLCSFCWYLDTSGCAVRLLVIILFGMYLFILFSLAHISITLNLYNPKRSHCVQPCF